MPMRRKGIGLGLKNAPLVEGQCVIQARAIYHRQLEKTLSVEVVVSFGGHMNGYTIRL